MNTNVATIAKDRVLSPQRHAPASQATHIEQSRAIAQVQGALVIAQDRPRDEIMARDRMAAACQVEELAKHAFFSYSRGGERISGPSIHLATELARCWGNIDFGVSELRRDDAKGESEMMSYAWDLETNARNVQTFIVPHKRDTKQGTKLLTDLRDVYENNANNAARRLRENIFRVLPKAFVEEAKAICAKTLEDGGGKPIEQRRADLLAAFAALSVTRPRLEKRMERAADRFTAFDIAQLQIIYGSIKRGETTATDEFPDDTAAKVGEELKAKAASGAKAKKGLAASETPQIAEPAAEVIDAETGEVNPAEPGPDDPGDEAPAEEGDGEPVDVIALVANLTHDAESTDIERLRDWWLGSPGVAQLKALDNALYTELFAKVNARLKARK